MISRDFLSELKRTTEQKWSQVSIDPTVYGFQFQCGTHWNPGLSNHEILEYEAMLSMRFPHDFRAFLSVMNGTDLPTLNIFGSSGVLPRQSPGVYSYPRDIEVVKQLIEVVQENRHSVALDLASQGFHLPDQASLVPVYGHRYVVCTRKLNTSAVLSIVVNDVDAIVFGTSLREYLMKEFLAASPRARVGLPLEPT